jgi:hypothetical protein
MNLSTVLVTTFGDTPSQLTRAALSFAKKREDENVRFNDTRTSSFVFSLQRLLA